MILIKAVILFFSVLVYILSGMILHLLVSLIRIVPREKALSFLTMALCKFLKRLFNIKLLIEGDRKLIEQKGNFIISNHLSYLDGIILGSLMPLVFVSKSQIASWPLFGWMSRIGGTVFIDRNKKLLSDKYVGQISRVLNARTNILVFPEGTSTNGEGVRPFQSVFFEAPLNCFASILPVSINYLRINNQEITVANRDQVFWYGQLKFKDHLFKALKLKKIQVKLTIHPLFKLDSFPKGSNARKQLSERLRELIVKGFVPVIK